MVSFIQRHVRFLAALVVGLLIAHGFTFHEPINPDGLLYLQAAQTYITDGLKASLNVFNWPLLPILIAWMSKFTGGSFFLAAKLVNIGLAILTALAFLSLVEEMAPKQTPLVAAFFIIIIYPALNRAGLTITRDCGYWAMLMFGLVSCLRFTETPRLRVSICYAIWMVLATLFRVEGVVIYALLPFALLFQAKPWQKNVREFFLLQAPLIVMALIIGCYMLLHPQALQQQLDHMAYVSNKFTHLQENWFTPWQEKVELLKANFLGYTAHDSACTFLLGGSLLILVAAIYHCMNLIFWILAGYGYKKARLSRNHEPVLLFYIAINVVILTVFVLQTQFIAPRYTVPLAWPLLVLASIGLHHCYKHPAKSRWLLIVIELWLAILLAGNFIHTGTSKAYQVQAGEWLKTLPAKSKIYSNNKRILFYYHNDPSQAVTDENYTKFSSKTLHKYDYLVIALNKDELLPHWRFKIVKTFENKAGDKVVVYQVKR